MSAQAAVRFDEVTDDEMLDADTSAAILRWMETALVPDGVDADEWERWTLNGCKGRLQASGALITSAVLGSWARSGIVR